MFDVVYIFEMSAALVVCPPQCGCTESNHLFFCSELFEVNHIRTIYHMFIALLILFILSTLVVDFIDEGR